MLEGRSEQAVVRLGRMALPVISGAAQAQRVEVPVGQWERALRNGLGSQPPQSAERAERILHQLDEDCENKHLLRHRLCDLASAGAFERAFVAVMAWGIGTTGPWNRLGPLAMKALHGERVDNLRATRDAALAGADLEALWAAHRRSRPPQGLGQVSFGSKWLHFVGWEHQLVGSPPPLIYDANIQKGLVRCAGLDPDVFVAAQGSSALHGRAWVEWCSAASTAAASASGVSAADVEVALFAHVRDNKCPAQSGTGPCTLRGD